ncbi:MAG: hypothetical protein AAGH68_09565 [Pseudomonadota bacterium]
MEESRPFTEDDLLAYMRGTASADLSQRIDAAQAADPSLRAEIVTMIGVRDALRDEDAGNPPADFAWRKLQAAIEKEAAAEQRPGQPRTGWWQVAAVLLGLAVLGQGAYISTISTGSNDPSYRTASQSGQEHVLAIGFAPGTDIADISALLRQANARVIDGPGASGLYRVTLASEGDQTAARELFEASTLVEVVADE